MRKTLTRLLRGDFADRLESRRAYADKGQSRDFLSLVALQNLAGRWDIYFCDYVPADSPRAKGAGFEDGIYTVYDGDRPTDYKAIISRNGTLPRNLDLAAAMAHLQMADNADGCFGRREYERRPYRDPRHHANFRLPPGTDGTKGPRP